MAATWVNSIVKVGYDFAEGLELPNFILIIHPQHYNLKYFIWRLNCTKAIQHKYIIIFILYPTVILLLETFQTPLVQCRPHSEMTFQGWFTFVGDACERRSSGCHVVDLHCTRDGHGVEGRHSGIRSGRFF